MHSMKCWLNISGFFFSSRWSRQYSHRLGQETGGLSLILWWISSGAQSNIRSKLWVYDHLFMCNVQCLGSMHYTVCTLIAGNTVWLIWRNNVCTWRMIFVFDILIVIQRCMSLCVCTCNLDPKNTYTYAFSIVLSWIPWFKKVPLWYYSPLLCVYFLKSYNASCRPGRIGY